MERIPFSSVFRVDKNKLNLHIYKSFPNTLNNIHVSRGTVHILIGTVDSGITCSLNFIQKIFDGFIIVVALFYKGRLHIRLHQQCFLSDIWGQHYGMKNISIPLHTNIRILQFLLLIENYIPGYTSKQYSVGQIC